MKARNKRENKTSCPLCISLSSSQSKSRTKWKERKKSQTQSKSNKIISSLINMKKLCKKGKVHPSPSNQLAFLPATVLTLTAALSPEDKEVLSYLISCSDQFSGDQRNTQKSGSGGDHSALFNCNCFRCYMSYWIRWDCSPNRQLIHEIIDAFEDGLLQKKNMKNKRERRKRRFNGFEGVKRLEENQTQNELGELEPIDEVGDCKGDDGEGDGGGERDEGLEKGSLRRFVNFIGERIWGVWSG